jgi:hypothetical protein
VLSIKILLDHNSFYTLKKSVPPRSHCRTVLDAAGPAGFSSVLLTCTEAEARNLLLYIDHSPKAVALIEEALRAAGPLRQKA